MADDDQRFDSAYGPAHQIARPLSATHALIIVGLTLASMFNRELRARLRRHGLAVPLLEHDLIAEMHGRSQTLWLEQVSPAP